MNRLVPWAAAAVVLGVVAVAVVGWRLVAPDRGQYEEPGYVVEASHPGFEVRAYAPTLEARVTLAGTRKEATREGFQVLAGYIFGGNTARAGIDMTTPVSAAPASQTIDMTTPVSAAPVGDGWTVAFTMPSAWTLATLPAPDDDRVELVEVPGGRAAVRTFPGRVSEAAFQAEVAALHAAMLEVGLLAGGPAALAQFDPPWVLGPWRRNEVQVPLKS